jgi:hypothetical protein
VSLRLIGQFARQNESESARSAGDDDRFAGEIVRIAPPPRLRGQQDASAHGAVSERALLVISDSHEVAARNVDAAWLVVSGW